MSPFARSTRGSGWPAAARTAVDAVLARGQRRVHHRAEAVIEAVAQQRLVELGEHGPRASRVLGGGPQRVAGERGERGRLGALAADVADHEPPVAAAGREAVVEVAADLVALAGRAGSARRARRPGCAGARGGGATAGACGRRGRARRTAARCRARARRGGRGPRTARGRPPPARDRSRPPGHRGRGRGRSAARCSTSPALSPRPPIARADRVSPDRPRAAPAARPRGARARARRAATRRTLVGVSPSRITHVSASSRTHSRATLSIVALLVERLVEQLAGLGQQRRPGELPLALGLGAAALGDVANDDHHLAALLDVEPRAADLEVDELAVAAAQRQRERGRRRGPRRAARRRAGGPPRPRTRRPGRARSPSRPAPGTCSR